MRFSDENAQEPLSSGKKTCFGSLLERWGWKWNEIRLQLDLKHESQKSTNTFDTRLHASKIQKSNNERYFP